MDTHDNARTTRCGRMLLVQRLANGWNVAAVAQALVLRLRPSANGTIASPPKAKRV